MYDSKPDCLRFLKIQMSYIAFCLYTIIFSQCRSKKSKHEIADGEVRGILKVIASTGRFWHDCDKSKSMLSFQLKQVLSEYPDAEKTIDKQNTTLGETYLELVGEEVG
ncbi:hypothetical protein RchiOBHm_Chr5g0041771 [Rosa chinensis]|uniref:Uncharacterized protein n=1 Tax=Rosa chinensis TaxID=74649 RepID=A0A2P6QCW5_ROSCH|nr:hypothetical protein RchiOBHm_Chr5g0041771 [Rosa chinensis]